MDDDELRPCECDGHLKAAFEERVSGLGADEQPGDGRETDPDELAWFAERLDDWEEQRFALADQTAEGW